MKEIIGLKQIIDKEIQNIDFPPLPNNLYDPIKYILSLEAKRIRSIALLIAHQLYNTDYKNALDAALAIEMFHNFTLIHDDIMDNALLRRGSATVHKKWNKNIAILSGDTLLVKSYMMLLNLDTKIQTEVLKKFSETAAIVCEGQQMDMDFEKQNHLNIKDYIKMIEKKTSVLFASSFEIGALIGGANKSDQHLIYQFGLNLGIAFQLQDDLLDLYADQSKFGKRIGGDIITNKKTFLYLKSLSLAHPKQKEDLQNLYSSIDFNESNKIKKVKSIFDSLNIYESTLETIKTYHNHALDSLKKINIKNKASLNYFVDLLVKREL